MLALLIFSFTLSCLAAETANLSTEGPLEFDSSVEKLILSENFDLEENSTAVTDGPPGINPNDKIKLEAKCQEPKELGNGTQTMIRFYFDIANSSCQKFEYTGNGGNENNFPTELDCLNDCYIDVNEGDPVKEEDISLIGRSTDKLLAAKPDCLLPKDPGNCTEAEKLSIQQRFYFSPEWQSCLAFKYSGCGGNANRFASRQECERQCLVADGSVCKGPTSSILPETLGTSCADTKCPDEFVCAMGVRLPECCNKKEHAVIQNAYSEHCRDGSQAGGHLADYFMSTFSTSCADLLCSSKETCQQDNIDGEFAKCCRNLEITSKRTSLRKNDVKQNLPLAN
uniref:BPTI/Kunitz inhibitor domain-containing protein n=1 Tax=Ditylenchus dipsaci TaxID=166011 RepID=A0A915DAT1_9BILA